MNLVKVNWEVWKAATQAPQQPPSAPNLRVLRPHTTNHSPINAGNLSSMASTPVSPSNNGAESPKNVECGRCGRRYKLKSSLRNHQKWECGKEPRFQCPYCVYRAKQKMHVERHIERMHKDQLRAFYDNNETLIENFGKEDLKMKFPAAEKGNAEECNECGDEPGFQCPYCVYKAKQKVLVEKHIEKLHKDQMTSFYVNNEPLVENLGREDGRMKFSVPERARDIVDQLMPESLQQA